MIVLWIFVILGCAAGGMEMLEVVGKSGISAPQQAGAMSVAIGFAVIPYCAVRAIQLAIRSVHNPAGDDLRKIREALDTHTRLLATVANATPAPKLPPTPARADEASA